MKKTIGLMVTLLLVASIRSVYADPQLIVKTANKACQDSVFAEAVRAQNTLGDGVSYTFFNLDASGYLNGWIGANLQSWLPVSGYKGDVVQIGVQYNGDLNPNCSAVAGSAKPVSIYGLAPGVNLINSVSLDPLIKGTVIAMATRRGIKCDEINPVLLRGANTINDSTFKLKYACDFGHYILVSGYIEDSQVQVNSFIFN